MELYIKNKRVNLINWGDIISIKREVYILWRKGKQMIPVEVYILRYRCKGFDKIFLSKSYVLLGLNAGRIVKEFLENVKYGKR